MITYKYEAISNSGAEISGVIKAMDESDAVIQLKDSCTLVKSLKPVTDTSGIFERMKIKDVSEKQLSLVCQQFSIILNAGLPIVRTVQLVAQQTSDKTLRKILTEAAEDVNAGFSLSDSLELRGPQLPRMFVETLRAGEESGMLEETFARLATYYNKRSKIRAKLIAAITYPIFVIIVAIVVVIVIMAVAIPKFTETFETMNIELPLLTKLLIAVSNFCASYFWIFLLVAVAMIVGFRVYYHTDKGRYNVTKIWLKLPVLGKIQLTGAASQLANTLATMLTAGIPVIRALSVTGRSLNNYYLGTGLIKAAEQLEQGFRLQDALRTLGIFPDLLVEMAAVGEESGSLEDTLTVIGAYYDNEVELLTNRAASLLEPIIICFLAVFVVLILLAVYLPMFSMYSGI